MVRETLDYFGHIDILIQSASIGDVTSPVGPIPQPQSRLACEALESSTRDESQRDVLE
jgi:hypothetical protein